MAAHRFVAVVGARVLPGAWAHQVGDVVRFFASRGWGVGSGGARGADAYALHALLACGRAACGRSAVFLPGPVGAWRNRELRSFKAQGGRVVLGAGVGRAALLGRSRRLAQESAGVVAFLFGAARGSVFTVREAIRSGKPAAVVLAGGGAVLPAFPGGTWAPCSIAGVAAHRWVPGAERPNGEEGDAAPSALHRIFVVPEGEPTGALLTHISSLTQGERLWFEQAVLAAGVVLMPHEVLSDTPAFLALPRLRRRFRCSVREAAGLGELFLALEAGPGVVAHYEREARRYGVEPVLEQLLRLVVQLALVEDVAETDALTDAERLGDGVDDVDVNGRVALAEGRGGGELLAWHVVGAVQQETVACPGCGGRYVVDDEAAETPVCPGCGAPDTWEARQGGAFVGLVPRSTAVRRWRSFPRSLWSRPESLRAPQVVLKLLKRDLVQRPRIVKGRAGTSQSSASTATRNARLSSPSFPGDSAPTKLDRALLGRLTSSSQ